MDQATNDTTIAEQLLSAYARKGTLTINDFCAWASIGRSKFYEQVRAGRLVTRKIGGKTVVTMPDALIWLDDLPETV